MPDWLGTALISASIPSALFSAFIGIWTWKYKKKEEKREAAREAKDKAIVDFIVMNIQGTNAAISVSEAIGAAVARIPDAHCNGDMTTALKYAGKVKHQMRDFMTEQGVHHIFDD